MIHLITIVFTILKLIGVPFFVTASWWLILAPTLFAIAMGLFVLFLGVGTVAAIAKRR